MWPRWSRPRASAVLTSAATTWRSVGNRFDVVAYSDVQFMKAEPVLRAQNAANLTKSESALAELREKGIEL